MVIIIFSFQPRLNVFKRNIKYYLPDDAQNNKLLGYWFLTCSGMVFGAVVLGMLCPFFVLCLESIL